MATRLEDDIGEISGRMKHHLCVMIYFYANYYQAIIMASILGAVSGTCLFYIANKGWATASNYVITVFVVSTVIAAYFFSLIAIFREQDNITANKALYLKYVALSNEIVSYCATGTAPDQTIKTTDEYIHQVDKEMAGIADIAVSFDANKIPDYNAPLQQKTSSGSK